MGESQVYSEHDGFGVSTSRDGLHWSEGVDVVLPGGCRTPLGVIDEGASVIMTRSSRAIIESTFIVVLFIHNPLHYLLHVQDNIFVIHVIGKESRV